MEAVALRNGMSDVFDLPVKQALIRMVVPVSIGFIMLMAVDFADVFIARVFLSDDALAVIGYCYPLVYFMMAIGVGLNQGLTIIAAPDTVHGGTKKLYEWFIQSIYLTAILTAVLILATASILYFKWVDHEFIHLFSDIQYFLGTIIFAIFPTFMVLALFSIAQIKGKPNHIRDVLALMLFATVIFHPVLAVWSGLGLAGLALSKTLVPYFGAVFMAYRVLDWQSIAALPWRPSWAKLRLLSQQVLPASGIQLLVPLYLVMLTKVMTAYGVEVVAGFSLGYRIVMFVIIPILGVFVALLVLISNAFAKHNILRVRQLLGETVVWGSGIILASLLSGYFVSRAVFGSVDLIERIALQYITLAVYITVLEYLIGVMIVSFQSIKQPKTAFVIALSRTVIFPVPILYTIHYYGPNQVSILMIWYALGVSFTLALLFSYSYWQFRFWPKLQNS